MKEKKNIVIVEDNTSLRLGMAESLRREGHSVTEYSGGEQALREWDFVKYPLHLAISDVRMEPMDGLTFLEKVKQQSPTTQILMISAYGSVETAVKAMQLGAGDFLTKPFSHEELRLRVMRLLERIESDLRVATLTEENRILQDEVESGYDEIIGRSDRMRPVFEMMDKIAREGTTILIEGESGTGKELIARAIHRKSDRSEKSFIKVNCGALNDNLLESELFGHEKGAFTGAIRQKKGRFELAQGGSLFLDEVGDISMPMQVKLLRVLQEREFERVGGEQTLSVDVRIIAATHRDLAKMVSESSFREDLYYRLRVIPLSLPPLRDRPEDIPLLTAYFIQKLALARKRGPTSIHPDAVAILQTYPWPGNVRELENLLERLCVISISHTITVESVAQHLTQPVRHAFNSFDALPLEEALSSFEKKLISDALRRHNGNKTHAAKALGIKVSTLYSKLERLGLLS